MRYSALNTGINYVQSEVLHGCTVVRCVTPSITMNGHTLASIGLVLIPGRPTRGYRTALLLCGANISCTPRALPVLETVGRQAGGLLSMTRGDPAFPHVPFHERLRTSS